MLRKDRGSRMMHVRDGKDAYRGRAAVSVRVIPQPTRPCHDLIIHIREDVLVEHLGRTFLLAEILHTKCVLVRPTINT